MYICLSLIAAGAYFIAQSGLEKLHLISEGAAFIMVGIVGLIMSTTTTDIGQSIMLAIREEGETTRASNRKLVRHMGKVIVKAIREEGKQTRASIEDIGKQIGVVSNDIKAVSNDIKAVSNDIKAMSKDNREFFRQMLEAQNRILGKVS